MDADERLVNESLSLEYIVEAQMLASDISAGKSTDQQDRDIVDYVTTLVHEINRLRGRIAYLEGWVEGVKPCVTKHRPRPPVYRGEVVESTTPDYPGRSRFEGRNHV